MPTLPVWKATVTPPQGEPVVVDVPHSSPDPRTDAVAAFREATGSEVSADLLKVQFANA